MRLRPFKLVMLILVLAGFMAAKSFAKEPAKIRFGALPVLQALPIYVAEDKGLFAKAGVNVDVIPFNTAAEKDIALATGSIDGYFGDLVTPIVLKGNGRDVSIVATNYDTSHDRRMFAILGKPGGPYKSLSQLASVPIAISSNTVIDYVTETLLKSKGIPRDKYLTVETKNIGLRMQMLMSGQVEAATLPEPLVTAAIAKGATLLADDSGLAASQTILAFSGPFLKEHRSSVKAFLKAVDEAGTLIKADPDSVRSVMVKNVRLPDPLKAIYPVPRFPKLHSPNKDAVNSIAEWLKNRGVIISAPTYEQVVNAGFLP
jgi:NitT/TauT family transport system substrate-binding protein